jgi:hypothetical protein
VSSFASSHFSQHVVQLILLVPGALGFQLMSDAFSMVYSRAILLALDIIEETMTKGHDATTIWDASKRQIMSKTSLQKPLLHCDPKYCAVNDAPECLNFELPTYGVHGPVVEDSTANLNPYGGETQNWNIPQPTQNVFCNVNKDDVVYFQDHEDREICRILDICNGIQATSPENGMVVFRLPKME